MAEARNLARSMAYGGGGVILINPIIGFYTRSTGKNKVFARGTRHKTISFVLAKVIHTAVRVYTRYI